MLMESFLLILFYTTKKKYKFLRKHFLIQLSLNFQKIF